MQHSYDALVYDMQGEMQHSYDALVYDMQGEMQHSYDALVYYEHQLWVHINYLAFLTSNYSALISVTCFLPVHKL